MGEVLITAVFDLNNLCYLQHKQVDKGTVLHITVPLSSGLVDVVRSLPEVSTEPLAGGNT